MRDAPHRVAVLRVRAVTFAAPRSLSPRHFHSAGKRVLRDGLDRTDERVGNGLTFINREVNSRSRASSLSNFHPRNFRAAVFSHPAIRQIVFVDSDIFFYSKVSFVKKKNHQHNRRS